MSPNLSFKQDILLCHRGVVFVLFFNCKTESKIDMSHSEQNNKIKDWYVTLWTEFKIPKGGMGERITLEYPLY